MHEVGKKFLNLPSDDEHPDHEEKSQICSYVRTNSCYPQSLQVFSRCIRKFFSHVKKLQGSDFALRRAISRELSSC